MIYKLHLRVLYIPTFPKSHFNCTILQNCNIFIYSTAYYLHIDIFIHFSSPFQPTTSASMQVLHNCEAVLNRPRMPCLPMLCPLSRKQPIYSMYVIQSIYQSQNSQVVHSTKVSWGELAMNQSCCAIVLWSNRYRIWSLLNHIQNRYDLLILHVRLSI